MIIVAYIGFGVSARSYIRRLLLTRIDPSSGSGAGIGDFGGNYGGGKGP